MSEPPISFLDIRAGYLELKKELDEAYRRVMDSGWYVLGNENKRFESGFAKYCDRRHCMGVSNGLDAISLTLRAYGIGKGDEVIVPAHTFIATWLAVSQVGATPVAVDVRDTDYNIDPSLIESAITAKTRVIIPVHLYGHAAEMDKISKIALKYGLKVIEDAAQAHGMKYNGATAGSLGDAAAFSFYPGKNLGAFGDGGAIVTSDTELAEQVAMLRNYGSREKYNHEEIGCNARLDELQAAFLTEKLKHLDQWNDRRRKVAGQYIEAFSCIDSLFLPEVSTKVEPSWHLFVLRHRDRSAFRQRLAERGVDTLVHYPITPFNSGAYKHLQPNLEKYPVANQLAKTVVSLPIGPQMTQHQIDRVVEAVIEAV